MDWHEKLAQRRKATGLTQKAAARKLGMTQQGSGKYESGRTRPHIDMLMRMAQAFDFDLDWLVDPNPDITLDLHRHIRDAIRRLGAEEAYDRLLRVPEGYTPAGQVTLGKGSSGDVQGQDQGANTASGPRRAR